MVALLESGKDLLWILVKTFEVLEEYVHFYDGSQTVGLNNGNNIFCIHKDNSRLFHVLKTQVLGIELHGSHQKVQNALFE